ncbi:methyltransferase domain-containing protein [Flavihumibacter profundi]|uniref:methyltransferase domain-containing protein n=1 Tax=Flavihumibacter profundi TaxID=2716883 RepID=UPI001CC52777|nr:methyltransferase domain-containing protein [Flavihumibacter profundi]MBZ5855738.1 methyltransferase domain-containing protein [Flavihumibacter profundi]
MTNQLDENYWNNRYRQHQTGWDIGYPSTPLKAYIDQVSDKNLSILVPGCGNGYEVEYLLQQGFQKITIIDIAPAATAALEKKLHPFVNRTLTIVTGDFFTLTGKYELALEQTFFCALDPKLRNAYAQKMYELLKPKGKLAGVLFNRNFEGGPPFGGHLDEYEKLFRPYFNIKKMEPCYNSIDARKTSELFIILEARKN